jgi:hypothetical protein
MDGRESGVKDCLQQSKIVRKESFRISIRWKELQTLTF